MFFFLFIYHVNQMCTLTKKIDAKSLNIISWEPSCLIKGKLKHTNVVHTEDIYIESIIATVLANIK